MSEIVVFHCRHNDVRNVSNFCFLRYLILDTFCKLSHEFYVPVGRMNLSLSYWITKSCPRGNAWVTFSPFYSECHLTNDVYGWIWKHILFWAQLESVVRLKFYCKTGATIVLISATLCHTWATLCANLGYLLFQTGLLWATKDSMN